MKISGGGDLKFLMEFRKLVLFLISGCGRAAEVVPVVRAKNTEFMKFNRRSDVVLCR